MHIRVSFRRNLDFKGGGEEEEEARWLITRCDKVSQTPYLGSQGMLECVYAGFHTGF